MGQAAFLEDMDTGATGEQISDGGDFLGGYNAWESNLYACTIAEAYFTCSSSGAKCLNVTFKNDDNKELKQQFWMTTNKAKGCKAYFVTKQGDKNFLPGFVAATHLALLTSGKELKQLVLENKFVKIYNSEQKKEVPTEVPMCVEMLGKQVTLGVIKRIVDKTKDSNTVDAQGNKVYLPTGETRTENEVVKIFRTRDRMTVTEIRAKAEKAEFADKWLEKWKDQVEDRSTKGGTVNGNSGAPGAPNAGASTPAAEVTSLFN